MDPHAMVNAVRGRARSRAASSAAVRSLVTTLALAMAMSACQTPQLLTPAPKPVEAPPPAPPPVSNVPAPEPVIYRSDAEIKQLLDATRMALNQGQEDEAASELAKVLASDPSNKSALALQRALNDDPVTIFGSDSQTYRVQSGDMLAAIVQRAGFDRDYFYALARMNGIKVPNKLPMGQTIKVPGKRMLPATAVPRTEATTATAAPAAAPAPAAATPAAAPTAPVKPPPPAPPALSADQLVRKGRAAMARQDVCGAIAAFEQALRLDAGHRAAALERERALELKKKLPGARC